MEKYHIYEEIGKGEFSQVFKGREKKQIEYVAIKRVDKTMMNKVSLFSIFQATLDWTNNASWRRIHLVIFIYLF